MLRQKLQEHIQTMMTYEEAVTSKVSTGFFTWHRSGNFFTPGTRERSSVDLI